MSSLNPGLLQLPNGACVYWVMTHLARAVRWPNSCKTSTGPDSLLVGCWWGLPLQHHQALFNSSKLLSHPAPQQSAQIPFPFWKLTSVAVGQSPCEAHLSTLNQCFQSFCKELLSVGQVSMLLWTSRTQSGMLLSEVFFHEAQVYVAYILKEMVNQTLSL